MPNLPGLSQVPFISPGDNAPPGPCSRDEVHGVSYLGLSITRLLLAPASAFKVVPLEPLMSEDSVALPVVGGVPQCPQRDWPAGSPSRSEPVAAGVPGAPGVTGEATYHPG